MSDKTEINSNQNYTVINPDMQQFTVVNPDVNAKYGISFLYYRTNAKVNDGNTHAVVL